MFRLIVVGIAVGLAYRLGEQKAQLSALDFFISRTYIDGVGVEIREYLQFEQSGNIVFTSDVGAASSFNLFEAKQLKKLLGVYAPSMQIDLEIVNNALLN